MQYKKSDFYYDLPEELIAQTPATPRDSSRLLTYNRATGEVKHEVFRDIIDYLHAGDVLVINNTRCCPPDFLQRPKTAVRWKYCF